MDSANGIESLGTPGGAIKTLIILLCKQRFVLGAVRTSLGKLKDNIHSAQFITRASTPSSLKASITKFKIPRREDIQPEGIDSLLCKGYCPAEFVVWTDALVASCRSGAKDEDPILPSQKRIILFAHGGAYCVCSPQTHRPITTKLSKYTNSKVLAIDYRLSPQHTFPAALQDMLSAFMFLTDPPPGNRKYRPDQVVFVGRHCPMKTVIILN